MRVSAYGARETSEVGCRRIKDKESRIQQYACRSRPARNSSTPRPEKSQVANDLASA